MAPRSATAMTAMALGMPLAMRVVPSTGSTATSHSGPLPSPTCSPLKSIGAWSFSPSPMTTTPFMLTVPMRARIASTAAPSPPFLSPRPTQRPAAIAPASVTRTSSRARLRSGAGRSERKLPPLWVAEPSGRGRDTRTSCGRRKDLFLPTLRKLRVGPEKGPWAAGWGGESCHPRGVSSAGPTSQPPAQAPSPAIERANRLSAANMLRSLGPLVLICLALVSWMAFKQSGIDPVREVDPSSTVQLAAARAGYLVAAPEGLPDGYRPTSARTDAGDADAGDPVTLEIGYLTPSSEYAGFVVSDDARVSAVADVLGGAQGQGTVDLAGQTWTRGTTERGETFLSAHGVPSSLATRTGSRPPATRTDSRSSSATSPGSRTREPSARWTTA